MLTITADDFDEMILRSDKPALVEIYAPWCVYCRRIAPTYEKIAEQFGEKLTVGTIHYDEQPELVKLFGIETIPTLMLFRDGTLIGSVTAPSSKAEIEDFILRTLEG